MIGRSFAPVTAALAVPPGRGFVARRIGVAKDNQATRDAKGVVHLKVDVATEAGAPPTPRPLNDLQGVPCQQEFLSSAAAKGFGGILRTIGGF